MNSLPSLDFKPPFVWPEARWHAGHGEYPDSPPFRAALREATLLAGVVTGLADGTIGWLGEIFRQPGTRRIRLVFAVYPAGPTRAEHLLAASLLAAEAAGSGADVQFRVLPVERAFGDDCELPSLPPSLLYAQAENGTPLFCFGSTGDGGCDAPAAWSFNAVFQPDDSLRDAWRRWFGFITEKAVPLTAETAQIPHLAPARGDIEAARQWQEFVERCAATNAGKSVAEPQVNPETGEVIPVVTDAGTPSETWDGDATKLDPLAREFGRIYAVGKLVTVDESTRLKPLVVSVTAATFGEQSEKTVGNVRRKQQFILEILDEATTKEVEKCRKIGDVVRLLSLQLSQGVRWIPQTAIALLEREIEARNKRGAELLGAAVGNDVEAFIKTREKIIRENLNGMYRDLGHGDQIPEDRVQAVLEDVRGRLKKALASSVAPTPVFNPIAAPNLTNSAGDEAWGQPLSLALHAARALRQSISDPYFQRQFKPLVFTQDEFEAVMDVFGDHLCKERKYRSADAELTTLAEIEASDALMLDKCRDVVALMRGDSGKRGLENQH